MAAVVFLPTRKDWSSPVASTSSGGEGPGKTIVVKLTRHQLWRAVWVPNVSKSTGSDSPVSPDSVVYDT